MLLPSVSTHLLALRAAYAQAQARTLYQNQVSPYRPLDR